MTPAAAQVAVLGTGRRTAADHTPDAHTTAAAPVVRLVAFGALALYGTLRWSTLLAGDRGRMLGLLALALVLAGARPALARRNRTLAAVGAVLVLVGVLAGFAVAGVPVRWIVHLRISVIANTIGQGIATLPQMLLPYTGVDRALRLVVLLGGAVLLFDAALLLAFAPAVLGDLRRAGAALPLVALAVIPTALMHPRFPYLDGLVLFLLLASFLWAERIPPRRRPGAVAVCLLAALVAMVLAPGLEQGRPWFNYQAASGSFAPRAVDSFDWSQNYGPVDWPRRRRTVLEIQASRPEYWKAENLDVFDGHGWTEGLVPGAESTPLPSAGARSRWSQTINVTVVDMTSSDVIGSGVSRKPVHILPGVIAGLSPGTWITSSELAPGDTYTVKVYDPDPTAAQLQTAGADYSEIAAGYRTILLPPEALPGSGGKVSPQIVFPPFHSDAPVENVIGLPVGTGTGVIDASPYSRAYRLARSLADQSATPYAFALAVERFLGHGFTYSENVSATAFPLESFLFSSRKGYCQHFAGAMALLLRMGGVPARVAVGFSQGRQDQASGHWLVTDIDAHAWVEAWFPHYGWVGFDPTPAGPAIEGQATLASGLPGGFGTYTPKTRGQSGPASTTQARAKSHPVRLHGGGVGLATWAPLAVLALVAALSLIGFTTRPLRSVEALVDELERALARTGRSPTAGTTLAELEQRMRGSPEAAAYIRGLRLARFGGSAGPPSAGRRALRHQLRVGLGALGTVRALWALPPRRSARRTPPRGAPGA
jgi:Transglutaminase-like superfamily